MNNDRRTLQTQYADASNLNARSAIYRFADAHATPWPRWVFEQLDLPPSANVLEIGCGDGALWKRNRERLPAGWRITMLDLSYGMLASARRELPATQFAFVQSDAERLPLLGDRYDAVIANHMLYHVRDLPGTLREIRRVLKSTGRLFATTNSLAHLGSMSQLADQVLGAASPFRGRLAFNMETGAAAIGAAFARVEPRPVDGTLRVTDADAIVRYVMSSFDAPARMPSERLDELRRRVEAEIDANGAFVIRTSAGMFVASD